MSRTVELTRGYQAIVDDEDYEWVSRASWYAVPDRQTVYAKRVVRDGTGSRNVFLHQEVLRRKQGWAGPWLADHIDGNGLNNRRENLRSATASQNMWNRRPQRSARSPLKGVQPRPAGKRTPARFRARITIDRKTISLGDHETAQAAALAYDRAAEKLFGDFARLNFPRQGIEGLTRILCAIAPRGDRDRSKAT